MTSLVLYLPEDVGPPNELTRAFRVRKIEERDDEEKENFRPEEPMEQDPDQAGSDDEKTSVGAPSRLDFNFLDDEEGTETLAGTTEPAEDETSTPEPPSAFMNSAPNLPESSSPGKTETTRKKRLTESPRRRRLEGAARVPFSGNLPEEEWEVHLRDQENRTGCGMNRVAFMEEIWTVVQCYGPRSMLKTGPNRPLMRKSWTNVKE